MLCRKEYFGALLYNEKQNELFEMDEEAYCLLKHQDRKIIEYLMENFGIEKEQFEEIRFIDNSQIDSLSAPLKVYLSITNLCNLNCKHCFNHDNRFDNIGEMPLYVLENIMNILEKSGVTEVIITGGEPFCHSNIKSVIDIIDSHSLTYIIYTNGVLLNEDIIEHLKGCQYLKKIKVSLEGGRKETDYIRGDGVFDKVTSLLRTVAIGQCEINVTLNNCNYRSINKMMRQLTKRNINLEVDIGLMRYTPYILNKRAELSFSTKSDYKSLARYVKKCGYLNEESGNEMQLSYISDFGCPAGQTTCAIDINGDVYACGLFLGMSFFKCGNILESQFNEIWLSETMEQFRNIDILESCVKCKCFLKQCRGGCRGNAYFYNGTIHSSDPFCEFYKRI